ncbi:30S ribosomal protein S11 [bacterium BMS3Abin15]|nr:30S ribosomal protein S11 [bacterium BMS3Abin15]HDZ85838.1 30S ribosomal protein S11 [Candidatus Moranbacteria bacterium]
MEEIKKAKEKEGTDQKSESVEVPKKKKRKIRHHIQKGQAHIQCTYNNTVITIADINGAALGWSSAGLLGFKGAKKATPYAATQIAADVAEKVKKYGIKELEVYVKGVGSGREASIRSLANNGFNLVLIKDITPIPHNGCRPRKPRRV